MPEITSEGKPRSLHEILEEEGEEAPAEKPAEVENTAAEGNIPAEDSVKEDEA